MAGGVSSFVSNVVNRYRRRNPPTASNRRRGMRDDNDALAEDAPQPQPQPIPLPEPMHHNELEAQPQPIHDQQLSDYESYGGEDESQDGEGGEASSEGGEASSEGGEASTPGYDYASESDHDPDADVLVNFQKHVAHEIWEYGREKPVIKVHSHVNKMIQWSYAEDASTRNFRSLFRRAGFCKVRQISYRKPNKNLILAFVERWHPETNTFHMPFGEMTITLDDVYCITGLPISGRTVAFQRDRQRPSEMIMELLNVDRDVATEALGTIRGHSVMTQWLHATFKDDVTSQYDDELEGCVRAYLLYMFGTTLFPDKSGNRVHASWLEFLRNLDDLHKYAWGAAVLAYLYRQLGLASETGTRQISGYSTLLEAWIYEHFPHLYRLPTNGNYMDGYPLAMKWGPEAHSAPSIEIIKALRERIDGMDESLVIWDPYVNARHLFPRHDVTFFEGLLSAGDIVEPYMPDRVLRQFGHVQTIPRVPLGLRWLRTGTAKANSRGAWGTHADLFERWRRHTLTGEDRGRLAMPGWESAPGYLEWYSDKCRPRVQKPERGGAIASSVLSVGLRH